jgi:hypothetical protein
MITVSSDGYLCPKGIKMSSGEGFTMRKFMVFTVQGD